MSQHWNIQINIQHVEDIVIASRGMTPGGTDRKITEVLKLAIVADSEKDAYSKAHRMLFANQPNVEMTLSEAVNQPGYPTEGTFANPRKIRDNPQA